jgi:hypothetical protein
MNASIASTNRRRSQRVGLQMPVTLEMEVERGKPLRIDAFTLIVNAHGGLLELGLPLRVGQKLSIIHPVSVARKTAKIVGLRRSQDSDGFLLAFEFDSPTPSFWPVEFPPEDWATMHPGGV